MGAVFSYMYPVAINLALTMDSRRLSKMEIVRRLFRKYSTSNISKEEKLDVFRRIVTKLSTTILSPTEIKEALIRLISRLR
jgi:hypothetical protein